MKEKELRGILDELGIDVVHKNGKGWLIAACPFAPFTHEFGIDNNPSFNVKVNPTGYSAFNCYACGEKGNIVKLITKLGNFRDEDYDKLVFRSLRKEIPDHYDNWDDVRFDRAFEEMDPLDVALFFRMYGNAWDDKEARVYLKKRGITRAASEALELRFDPDSKRVLFPVYDFEKNLFGFTGRTILMPGKNRPKVRDYAGLRKERCLLGEHLIDPEKPMLLVEGLMAEAHMVSIGVRSFANPVASMGAELSHFQANALADYAQAVYILYDLDMAGDKGIYGPFDKKAQKFEGGGAYDKLRKHVPTFICEYPEGVSDPDKFTLEDVKWAMENHVVDGHLI